jgi:hypothetical protein
MVLTRDLVIGHKLFLLSEPCCAYTLQRASWLLPIVDHGVENEDEVSRLHITQLQRVLIAMITLEIVYNNDDRDVQQLIEYLFNSSRKGLNFNLAFRNLRDQIYKHFIPRHARR